MGEGLAPLSAGIPLLHFMIGPVFLNKLKTMMDSRLRGNDKTKEENWGQ
jgi:hypothetical protein